MSDKENTKISSKVKIIIVTIVIVVTLSAVTSLWMNQSVKNDFNSLGCNDKEIFITDFWNTNGKNDLTMTLIDFYNVDCKSYGKFLVAPVTDDGFGMIFLPSNEMQDGVEYDMEIRTNKTESNEPIIEDDGFNIEIGR